MRKILVAEISNAVIALALLFGAAIAPRAYAQTNATFETAKITLAGKTLTVELADTPERRTQGLMFREKLAPDHGMLFIFDSEEPLAFWMKNTLIPLSIGYFDRDRKLVDVHEMVPAVAMDARPKTYESKKPAMYALEMPKGWFSQHKVGVGTAFSFAKRATKAAPAGH